MNLHIFHLKPRSSFHFGVRGVGMEATTDYGPSDTVFGALCSTIRYLYGKAELEAILQEFAEHQPLFQCSGAYPYVDSGQGIIRFYPAPLTLSGDLDSTAFDEQDSKKLRKMAWLSATVFGDWLEGRRISDVYALETVKALVTRDEAAAILARFDEPVLKRHNTLTDVQKRDLLNQRVISVTLPLWKAGDVPRVAIDRRTSAGNIFRAGRFALAQGVGLWLGFDYHDEPWCDANIPTVLHQLGDWGLGGERSGGYGQFDIDVTEKATVTYTNPSQHGDFVNLAYYYPRGNEYGTLNDAAYDLELRRGWMSNPESQALRRKAVRMITMGSVLKTIDKRDVYGSVIDVAPEMFDGGYPVYRNGYALAIGVRRS